MTLSLPGFARDALAKPIIDLTDDHLYAYGTMLRHAEERVLSLFGRGLLSGTTHTCIGQEICQMAVVRALDRPDDAVMSNHRNHGHFLTYSGDFVGLLAEVMGREAGVCRGYGGSQHIAYRHFHSNGIQAGMTGIGVGMAMERRIRGSDAVVAAMIGDGTLGEGLLYESMNLASTWRAPVLFVVENNGIAQTTPSELTLGGSIEARGDAFGLTTWRLDDSAPDFCARVADVVAEMRLGKGAGMLVIDTCRLGPHSKGDDLRTDLEKQRIRDRDPLTALGRRLTAQRRAELDAASQAFIDEVEQIALASPEARLETARSHAFLPSTGTVAPDLAPANSHPNMRAAINSALRDLLETDPRVVVLGEDLHEPYGGAFKVTAGLSEAFPGRVISTPISEAGIVGSAIGLAMDGMRPIVEIMFADFVTLCMDQLYNHAVKFPAMFDDAAVPLLIRTPAGGRRGYGPTHSQNPENLLVSVPGLTVLFPSHRHSADAILNSAVLHWPNPTVFLEHKLLYGEKTDPGDYRPIPASPLDPAADLFPTLYAGADEPDLTILTFGGMLPIVERAAVQLRDEEELAIEIIAPALLAPLPRATLLAHLEGRTRLLIVEESHHEFGVSAEIVAMLAEAGFGGRVLRVGLPPLPIAAARSLEQDLMPDAEQIVCAALDLI